MKGLTLIAKIGVLVHAKNQWVHWRWYEIKKGKRNAIYCTCHSGTVHKHQSALTQVFDPGTCDHIRALYEGRVGDSAATALRFGDRGLIGADSSRYRAIFTQHGEELFDWRRVAHALMRE